MSQSRIMPPEVLRAVAQLTGISLDEITGETRFRRVVTARYLAAWALRTLCRNGEGRPLSLTRIGYHLHRDHSTIHHGMRRTAERTASSPCARAVLARFKDRLP